MRSESCESARRLLSQGLDERLPELAQRRLRAHLSGCSECRAFDEGVRATTAAIRAEPMVELAREIALPARRRRRAAGAFGLASAAAAAVAAAAFGLFSLVSAGDTVRPGQQFSNLRDTEASSIRKLRLAELVAGKPAPLFTHATPMSSDSI
ncbi:MAG: zf-HC2 domain-containing protein [Gaiellaceae bacterium]